MLSINAARSRWIQRVSVIGRFGEHETTDKSEQKAKRIARKGSFYSLAPAKLNLLQLMKHK